MRLELTIQTDTDFPVVSFIYPSNVYQLSTNSCPAAKLHPLQNKKCILLLFSPTQVHYYIKSNFFHFHFFPSKTGTHKSKTLQPATRNSRSCYMTSIPFTYSFSPFFIGLNLFLQASPHVASWQSPREGKILRQDIVVYFWTLENIKLPVPCK